MAKPCNKSWIFDTDSIQMGSGENGMLLSLCDRVPPGRYALVRESPSTNPQYYIAAANSFGLRGLIFVLGDDSQPSTSPTLHSTVGLEWAPDGTDGAKAWQRHQFMLMQDRRLTEPLPGQMPGPISFRGQANANLVIGAAFICRAGTVANLVAAANTMAEMRNFLGLDFVTVDVDSQAWEFSGASAALTHMIQMMQNTFRRSTMAPDKPTLSSHYPVFVITPNSTGTVHNLLSPDGFFEPLMNGITGPTTFVAPRIPPNGFVSEVSAAWQWTRPYDPQGYSLSSVQVTVDVRNGGDPFTLVNLCTDENNGFTVNWPGLPLVKSVNSGMILFDSLQGLINYHPNMGRIPTRYWDFDNFYDTKGTLVPSWNPDPIPLLMAGFGFSDSQFGGLTLSFENWKTGHLTALNVPNQFSISAPNCSPARKAIHSWLKFDDIWMIAPNLEDTYWHMLEGNFSKFTGYPIGGDEGLYPLLMTFTGSQISSTPTAANETQISLMLNVVSNSYNSIGTVTTPVEGAGALHGVTPPLNSSWRIPNAWGNRVTDARPGGVVSGDTSSWCKGQSVAPWTLNPNPGIQSASLTANACGRNYIPEQILTLVDSCSNFGTGSPQSICDTWDHVVEYMGFVWAVAAVLSNFNSAYSNPPANQFGLYALPENIPFFMPRTDLMTPAFNLAIAASMLEAAWTDAQDNPAFICVGDSYEHRVGHALTYFLDLAGLYPNSHGRDFSFSPGSSWHSSSGSSGCYHTGGTAASTAFALMAEPLAFCFQSIVNLGLFIIPPTVPPTGPPPPTPPPGSGIMGCPAARGVLSWGCADHQANETAGALEGVSPSFSAGQPTNAVDIAYPGTAITNILATCSGTLYRKRWDSHTNRNSSDPNYESGVYPYGELFNCFFDGQNTPCGLGIYIQLNCDDGNRIVKYGHLDPASLAPISALPDEGDHVGAGDRIGIMGRTGLALPLYSENAAHVHYEMWTRGQNEFGQTGWTQICPEAALPPGCP